MSNFVVAVVGHHRGGTSATAGALAAMGLYLGPEAQLMKATPENPKGYFEHLPLVKQNDRTLLAFDRSWSDNRPFDEDWFSKFPYLKARTQTRRILAGLTEQAQGRPVVVKDPRLARLLPLYFDACERENLTLRAIVVERNVNAVVASLCRRNGWDEDRAREFVELQQRYLEEWKSTGITATLRFPEFLDSPEREVAGAIHRLVPGSLTYDPRDVAAFLDRELVHHE